MRKRKGSPLGFLLFDIDYFKDVNDTHGHGVGDEILQAVGLALVENCRAYDTPCRFGGDEFAVVIGQSEGREALVIAKRLLAGIADIRVTSATASVQITTSAGLVTTASIEGPVVQEQVFKGTDAALYEAKARGRDQIVVGEIT